MRKSPLLAPLLGGDCAETYGPGSRPTVMSQRASDGFSDLSRNLTTVVLGCKQRAKYKTSFLLLFKGTTTTWRSLSSAHTFNGARALGAGNGCVSVLPPACLREALPPSFMRVDSQFAAD